MQAITCTGIEKQYKGTKALKGVSLTVEDGELLGLLGVNGAGKTTLIRILSTLTNPTNGEAYVYGKNVVTEADAVREITDVSPQETSVAPNLTVRENLEFFANVYALPKDVAKERINKIVKDFHLEEVLDKRAKTLSGGWQRRLSLGVALISDPKILFLDEPTLGLDAIARRELWRVIEKLKGTMTIVLTSHYLEEIEALCDRVIIMSKGNVVTEGTVEEIKAEAGEDNFEEAFVTIIERAGGSDVLGEEE